MNDGTFDEDWYLSQYPDIKEAVAGGAVASGYAHYVAHGRHEGRAPFQFDEAFYASSYPAALQDVDAGLATDLREHYQLLGWHRGYLPHAKAARKGNPQSALSRFGGLWPDLPHAADIIAGRLETGRIDAAQAAQLRHWISNGWLVIEAAVPEQHVAAALADLDKAYTGGFPDLKFECPPLFKNQLGSWVAELHTVPAKALDIHWFSPAVRRLIFSEKLRAFLQLIFESKALASQTLGFHLGSGQEAHQDSAYVPYSLQRNFAASWVALEDVEVNCGELFYYTGSHKLPDFLYRGEFKCVAEAERAGVPRDEIGADARRHVASLAASAPALGMKEQTFLAKRGDALLWHADLAHGGRPLSRIRSRRSIVTHYAPWRVAPLWFEHRPAKLFDHDGQGYYSTWHYPYEGHDGRPAT